jgi:hypothetical protein
MYNPSWRAWILEGRETWAKKTVKIKQSATTSGTTNKRNISGLHISAI